MARYYLDHNATTPTEVRVLERFVEVERSAAGNPGSLHSSGRAARAIVEQSRQQIADVIQRPADNVVFTSGGTESNNTVLTGLGDTALPVLLAETEHPSLLQAADLRGKVLWDTDQQGRAIVAPPRGDVGLVCLMHAQNEVGTIQPVAAARTLADELAVPLHVDASQTLGRLPLDAALTADSLAFSMHKCGGLRGSGLLIATAKSFRPMLRGGGQQQRARAGTESPALAAATATAFVLALNEQQQREHQVARVREAFLQQLPASIKVVTPLETSLPNTVMCLFKNVDGRMLLPALDSAGVEASQGSACSSGSPEPPRVLRAMGLSEVDAQRCVRFSFTHRQRVEDACASARIVTDVATQLTR